MATTNVTLKVEGMSCSGCEERLGTALSRVDGVSEATADHRTGELNVRYDAEVTGCEALEERVVMAGYEVAGTGGSA